MAKKLLPLRFRILYYASQKDSFNYQDLIKDLKEEYGNDGQFNKGMMNLHIDSLRAVGMIEEADVDFDKNNELLVYYRITDYGRDRLVYLPDEWKATLPAFNPSLKV
ncbi:MAG: DNA-binding protein [Bacillota bacterium]|jgi:DNA-binding PadR family transcriptional regulator